MVTNCRPILHAATALIALLLLASTASAQPVPGSVALTGEIGAGFYIGEFNSLESNGNFNPSLGLDVGGGLRWQIAENFALLGTVGYMQLSYVVDSDVRLRYGSNFFGPLTSTTYPGSTVELTKLNYIDATRFVLFGQSQLSTGSPLVPYFTLGLGLINFSVTNGLGKDLPVNLTGDYSNESLIMPLGLGTYYEFSDQFLLNAQALVYINSTDYLDGYAHFLDFESIPGVASGPGQQATPPDYPVTLTIGATYVFYIPEKDAPPIAAAEPVERPREPQPAPKSEVAPTDRDGDGLSDAAETERYLTDPTNPDTDGDALTDFDEVMRHDTSPNHRDTDRDGLSDGEELTAYNTKPLDADTDDDLLIDGDEVYGRRSREIYASTAGTPMNPNVLAAEVPTDPRNPDTDGDGVPDGLDACPRMPGPAANRGCPDATGAPVSGYRADFDGIAFQPNSDNFDLGAPGTVRELRELLALANECDEIGLLVEGHTSSEGSTERNQQLSTQRAKRVVDWLVANGVPRDRLLGAVGYGSRLPRVYEPSASGIPPRQLEEIRSRNRRITALVRRPCP